MDMKQIFSTKEVIKITGVTTQRLHHWTGNGVLTPYDLSNGPGTTRRYSYQNLLEIFIIKQFAAMGIHINVLRSITNALHENRSEYFNESLEETKKKGKKNLIIFRMTNKKSGIINIVCEVEYNKKIKKFHKYGYAVISTDISVLKEQLNKTIETIFTLR